MTLHWIGLTKLNRIVCTVVYVQYVEYHIALSVNSEAIIIIFNLLHMNSLS